MKLFIYGKYTPQTNYQTRSYKTLYQNQVTANRRLLFATGLILLLGIGILAGSEVRAKNHLAEIETLKSQIDTGLKVSVKYADYSSRLEAGLTGCWAKLPEPKISTGKVSYYSKDGCLGCSPNQQMANGQIFDENAMTFAHNGIPLNTMVEVKNLDNGKTVMAKVTDRGGFNRYSRVADLSKGLYTTLGAKTDVSNIQFTWY